MNTPCPTFDCPCDGNPLSGFLSEAPDVIAPLATAYVEVKPPLGVEYCDRGCVAFATEVLPPPGTGITPPTPEFFSTPQQCTATCPDGTPFVFQVSAGAFTGPTQAAADAAAMQYACQQANARQICLGPLIPTTFIENVPYSGSITATGAGLGAVNTWMIISGSLPAGLTFNGGTIAGNSVSITGTPTVEGTFVFTVQVSGPNGNTATKTYTMNCGIGYAVVQNYFQDPYIGPPPGQRTTGFAMTNPPDPGYDTRWDSLNSACFNRSSTFEADFTSPTLKTWNLKVVMNLGANPSSPLYSVLINGVVQGGFVVVGSTATLITSFTTNNCANTDVLITGQGSQSCISIMFEWQTPT